MIKRFLPAIALAASATAIPASAQDYPVVDRIAQTLIAKYQNSSCEQLWQEKAQGQGQPKSAEEQRAIRCCRVIPRCSRRSSARSPRRS